MQALTARFTEFHPVLLKGSIYQACFSFWSKFENLKMTPSIHIPYFGFVEKPKETGTVNTFQCRLYQ